MNVLDMILSDDNAVNRVAKQLGISEGDAQSGLKELIPALARGVAKNASSDSGASDLVRALETGKHERYLNEPDLLGDDSTIDDGNGILGHIFGNKDVSRDVATRASSNTGITSGILKKMLPIAASLVMGALSRGVLGGGGGGGIFGGGRKPQLGGLAGLLDFDRDGSVVDDILGLVARRFF